MSIYPKLDAFRREEQKMDGQTKSQAETEL